MASLRLVEFECLEASWEDGDTLPEDRGPYRVALNPEAVVSVRLLAPSGVTAIELGAGGATFAVRGLLEEVVAKLTGGQ